MAAWLSMRRGGVLVVLLGAAWLGFAGEAWGYLEDDGLLDEPGLATFFHPSAQYTPGTPVTVGLKATQFAWGNHLYVEDLFPAGWAISGISHSGTIQNGKVVWQMPLGGGETVTLTYVATPPAGATGPQWFRAVATFASDSASQQTPADRPILPAGSSCTLECGAIASTSSGIAPLSVQFTGSASPQNCSGSVSYDWDFGDGSAHATGQSPTHVYQAPGSYTWTMRATVEGVTCTRSGVVTVSPCSLACTAAATPTTGGAPLVVQFSSSTAGNCSGSVAYDWDFGDGSPHASQQNPSHTYTAAGSYTWKLTAAAGGQTCTKTGTVTVSVCSLACSATASKFEGRPPLAVTFTLSASPGNCVGSLVHDLDFGDGTPHGTTTSVTHTYTTAGVYQWTYSASVGQVSCVKSGRVLVSDAPPLGTSWVRAYMISNSGHTPGLQGTNWVSDAVLHNPGSADATATLYFLEKDRDNSASIGWTVTVPAGQSVKLADIVEDIFARSSSSGALLVGASGELVVTSRTFNDAADGTYGQYIEGYPLLHAIGKDEEVRLLQLTRNTTYRTNIGFANGTNSNLEVRLELRRANGALLGSRTVSLHPFGFTQITDVLSPYGSTIDGAYAVISSSSAGAAYFAYASVIDNRTGDPVSVVPVGRGLQALPRVARASWSAQTNEITPELSAAERTGLWPLATAGVTLQIAGSNVFGQFGSSTQPFVRTEPVEIPGLANVAQVSTGSAHALFRLADRRVYVLGANGSGQLGDGTFTHRSTPANLSGLSGLAFVNANAEHAMAVREVDGSVWEWGFGVNEPRQVTGLSQIVQAVGTTHRMVLHANGSVWGWGANNYGQLGNGNNTYQSAPVQVVGLGNVKQIAVGDNHTLALTQDGKVWAWGWNGTGAVGDGTNENRNLPVQVQGLPTIVQIAAGSACSYAVGSNGKVYAWGSNSSGELGDGTTTARNTPVVVAGLSGVVEVAGGWEFAVARTADGAVWAWGYNNDGELGDGTRQLRLTPVQVKNVSQATAIAAGDWQAYAVVAGGKVRAWGADMYGQLGVGRNVYSSTLVALSGLGDLVQVASRGNHNLAVRSNGEVVSWGSNYAGQLGYSTTWLVSEQPQVIPNLSKVASVAAGYDFSLALTSAGEVWAWGANNWGQLGSGNTTSRSAPAKVAGLPPIAAIAAGAYHALALSKTGKIWAWGYNGSGQIGNGTKTTQLTPVELPAPTGVKAIGAGYYHSLAITEDGSLWVWGGNATSQLGDGGSSDRLSPFKLTSISGVRRVAGGWGHTLAVKDDGSVWSWGINRNGQLGVGSSVTSSKVPVKVAGVTGAQDVVAGMEHSIALQGNAGISVWGRNWLGALGDGSTTHKYVPNLLYYLTDVYSAAAGAEHTLLLSGSQPCWLVCSAQAAPSSGTPPLAVSFTGSAEALGCPSAPVFDWDFGDGSPHSNAGSPSHTYTSEGVFRWRLTVTAGSSSCMQQGEVSVSSGCLAPERPVIAVDEVASSAADYTVSWSSTSPDGRYELQEATDPSFSDAQTFVVEAASRSFEHEVREATTYHYRVRALDVCGADSASSPWSATASVRVEPAAGQPLYVLAAAHLSGLQKTNWRTDLEVHNPTTMPVTFSIELLARDQANSSPVRVTRTLAADHSERFTDALATLFQFSGAATLRITPQAGRLMVTSRTYNEQPGGTYGQFIPAAASAEAVPYGQSAWLVQLAQSIAINSGFRTNLGFVNTTSSPLVVEGRLYRADGTLLATKSWNLRPYEYKQIDRIFAGLSASDIEGFAVLRTPTVGGAFLAYASVIDNRSGDPIFVPARVPAQGQSGRQEMTLELPGGVPLVLVRVPAGMFTMGSPASERGRSDNEGPQHSVTLSRDFFLGATEVTQAQWRAVMGSLPEQTCGEGDLRPVCNVSWNLIAGPGGFLERLNTHLAATGQLGAGAVRLPTEAEWEYAARAGSTSRFSFGDVLTCEDGCQACPAASTYMWWCGNDSPSGAKVAGKKQRNGFGLFDMHGNLWELVADWLGPYSGDSQVDPTGPASGTVRATRGGSFPGSLANARSAKRLGTLPEEGYMYVGFRVALTP